MDLVLLLNKLNNEVRFDFEHGRNFGRRINRTVSDSRFNIFQMGCSTESFERVGKRENGKNKNKLKTNNHYSSGTDIINSNVDVIVNTERDRVKRKHTVMLDEIPVPKKIIPKTILFNIDSDDTSIIKQKSIDSIRESINPHDVL